MIGVRRLLVLPRYVRDTTCDLNVQLTKQRLLLTRGIARTRKAATAVRIDLPVKQRAGVMPNHR